MLPPAPNLPKLTHDHRLLHREKQLSAAYPVVDHGSEVPYVFALNDHPDATAEELALSHAMVDAWYSMAAFHNPNGRQAEGLHTHHQPIWPRFGPASDYAVLNVASAGGIETSAGYKQAGCGFLADWLQKALDAPTTASALSFGPPVEERDEMGVGQLA